MVNKQDNTVPTFMYVSKNVEFWSNATLHSRDKFITTRLDTTEAEISISCQQTLTSWSQATTDEQQRECT